MSKAVQRRRGTTAEHTTFTGALAELTVDTTKDTVVVHDGAAAGGYPLLREDGSNSALAIGSAGTPSLKFTGDPNTGLYSPGADQVAISTGGTGRLFVDASGNTHVIAVDGQLSLSKTGLRQYQFRVTGLGATEGLAIRDESGATEIARFTQSGYFTVGGLRIKGSDTQNSIYQAGAFGLSSDNYITIGTGASQAERLRITSDGKVGIGTSSPGAKLHVSGSVVESWVADGTNTLVTGGWNGSSHFIKSINLGVDFTPLTYQAQSHIFFGSSSERVRIDSSGRLLVGTSSSLYNACSLQVVNDAAAQCADFIAGRADQYGPNINLTKSRGSTGSPTIVSSGDELGTVSFIGYDGSAVRTGASIVAAVDGTPGANDMPGRLVFSTTADGAATPTEAMRINNQRELLIGTTTRTANGGVLQISNGITFPGTQSACSDANTLDDYEEGTWTPAIQGLSNSPTYDNRTGIYTKVGRVVHVQGFIQVGSVTATYTSDTAVFQIGGLPFTPSASNTGYIKCRGTFSSQGWGFQGTYNDQSVTGQVSVGIINTDKVFFAVSPDNGIRGQVKNSGSKGAFILEFDLTYVA